MHGGATPRGIASPNFKHGRYSRALPERMAARVESALDDPELRSVAADLAVQVALIEESMSLLAAGGASALWRSLSESWERFGKARARGDVDGMTAAIAEVDTILGDGLRDASARDEITRLIDYRRRLLETEAKRERDLEQYIPARQAYVLIGAIVGVVRQYVTDTDTLTAISRGVADLVDAGGVGRLEAGDD
jgi:hypothetical protein